MNPAANLFFIGPMGAGKTTIGRRVAELLGLPFLDLDHAIEQVNDQVDWENVAEEIEDMGNNVVRGVASHLVQAILHDLKAEAWPLSRDVPHWPAEARGHRDEATEAYAASMEDRPELVVSKLYRRALRRMPDLIDDLPPRPAPDAMFEHNLDHPTGRPNHERDHFTAIRQA